MVTRHQSSRRDGRRLVHNGSLDIPLNCLHGGSIYDAAESSNSIGAVDDITSHGSILHNGAGNHDDIFGGVGKLLDDQVDHLAQRGILVLEQFGDAKEEGGCFVGGELLAGREQEREFREEDATFSR